MINIRYQNDSEDIVTRLLKVRGLHTQESQSNFLQPNFKNAWYSPRYLNDMDKAIARILHAIRANQKIMIFGDYDADGVTSSYVLYDFFRTFVRYSDISVQLPHRLEDGYGIKSYHLDQMKAKGVQLVITVDNGITSVQEALYASQIGIDMVVTDHHQPLSTDGQIIIPSAFAVVNPQVSPEYPFNGLCGAGVAFKVIMALSDKLGFDDNLKKQILYRYLPIVAIGTVSDCVPLLEENRLFVKKGLELINSDHPYLPKSLKGLLEFFNLHKKPIDTMDIGFMIGPRLNAAGRMLSAYEAFYALLFTGEKQQGYLEKLGGLNTERKEIQDGMIKHAIDEINTDDKILISCKDKQEYHEGIIGIVAGRLTEQFHKPSMILSIDTEKGIGVASLRGPEYFSVIDMLYQMAPHLERFGGHKQAGGLTVKIERIDALVRDMVAYCNGLVTDDMLHKKTHVDTILHERDMDVKNFLMIDNLKPFGEGNREPVLLLQNAVIKHKQTIGKKNKSHLKLYTQVGNKVVEVIQWNQGDKIGDFALNESYDLVVSHKWDGDNWYLTGE